MHVVLCGTGAPLFDTHRAAQCTAVIAGGKMYLIDVGPASDIYSLGLVLHELFTGKRPPGGSELEPGRLQGVTTPSSPTATVPTGPQRPPRKRPMARSMIDRNINE